ncbi:ATP-binding protein [Rhodovastum sp. RN2-1]|uniref:histidine kinase n=1 Tax=Limobrevibacterium gyesilva TaxID=2991712 RepID=A0AA41YXL0_9PROT|nr:ATP-binding protein [Limobrevibacterium gyesilva]
MRGFGPRLRALIVPGFGRLWAGSVAVPLACLAAAGWWYWVDVTRSQVGEAQRTVDMVQEQTMRALETQEAALQALQAYVHDMSWQQIRDSAARDFARRLVAATPSVANAGIIDPEGHVAVSSEPVLPPPGLSFADRDYVRAFPVGTERRATFVGEVIASRIDGRVQVHLSRPRLGPENSPDGGVITSAFTPEQFERFFSAVAETDSTGFKLVRSDGMVLACYPDAVTTTGNHLSPDDPVLAAVRGLGPGETRVLRSGSLLSGLQLTVLRQVGDYGLFVIHSTDPLVVRTNWLHQMTPAALGAMAAMLLLLTLTARAQHRTRQERADLLSRTTTAEEGRALAQERADLEAQLRQTEKVAALGQLAAGVAHDFNNLLQTLLLHAEMLQQRPENPPHVRSSAAVMVKACLRGTDLTRRMLDHARRDEPASGEINIEAALHSVQVLVGRSLGGRHRLVVSAAGALPRVQGSPAELESVLINLVVNARDAMAAGGDIALEASTEQVDGDPLSEIQPGRYLRLSVRDTGHGMDEATLARAGEAFFTTKERGKGTGLGLSMARGFAERAGGTLTLVSQPGIGTTVTLLLPVSAEARSGVS